MKVQSKRKDKKNKNWAKNVFLNFVFFPQRKLGIGWELLFFNSLQYIERCKRIRLISSAQLSIRTREMERL